MKFVEKYKNRAVELLIEILKVGEVYNDFWTFTQLFGANFLYYPDIDSIVTDNANEQTHSENFSLIDGHLKKNDLIDNFILVSNNDIGDNYKWHVFWSPFVYSLGRYFDTEKLHIPYNENYKKELEKLKKVDWARKNKALWEGRAMIAGKISKSHNSVILTTNHLKNTLGLKLTPEEMKVEKEYLAKA